jgi:hydrogenase maturation factor
MSTIPREFTGELGELADDLAAASFGLARRLFNGATMWCVSPSWPHHARHVAVEFVHPVIVGKRALPALVVAPHDPVAELRVSVEPGDVVVAVSTADDGDVADIMRRAHAWGVETVWIGTGPRPAAGAANHVVWLPEHEMLAPYDGRFILLYHLLWELTHVCFEHQGLLKDDAPVCVGEVCITCSDEGRLAEVVDAANGEALVRTATGRETIDVSLVDPVSANDLVLIHAGSAITKLGAPA